MAPTSNWGMTYQIDEKHLTNFTEYFVGAGSPACYCLNNHFLLRDRKL